MNITSLVFKNDRKSAIFCYIFVIFTKLEGKRLTDVYWERLSKDDIYTDILFQNSLFQNLGSSLKTRALRKNCCLTLGFCFVNLVI